MATLDVPWALEQLRAFIYATEQVAHQNRPGSGVVVLGSHMRDSPTEVAAQAQVVEQILERVIPAWRTALETPRSTSQAARWASLRELCARAIAQLQRDEELRQRLGDNAPQMDASQLHPWVWEGARSLWRTGHFRRAVEGAAIMVNAETQAKLQRREISETNLFKQAFTLDPPEPGRTRLRLMSDDGSPTYRNVHRGAMALAEGLYAGLRNPIAHDVLEELPEQVALEQLAAFSVLARWVDAAEVASSAF